MSNDIFVVVEQLKGKISDITFEMLGKGREMADALGGKLYAVLIGSQCAGLADELGKADGVLCVADVRLANFNPTAYKHALGELVRERAPRLLMIGNTSMGMDLAAGVSALLNIPLIAYCNNLRVEEGKIVATAQIYGGKLFADAEATGDQLVVSILAGSFSADAGKATGHYEARHSRQRRARHSIGGQSRTCGRTRERARRRALIVAADRRQRLAAESAASWQVGCHRKTEIVLRRRDQRRARTPRGNARCGIDHRH